MNIDAMKQALGALIVWEEMYPTSSASAVRQPAIAALRQAIAEAEPEPVAKTYDMARFQVPEGMYSIKELEEMLADMKEAKKRQDDHLKVAMQPLKDKNT